MNHRLKLALLEHGDHQYDVARRLEMSESRLSRIVQNRVVATQTERQALAEFLGANVRDLFEGDRGAR